MRWSGAGEWDPAHDRACAGVTRQKPVATEILYRDRPLMLLCRDIDFSVATELSSSQKKKKRAPRFWVSQNVKINLINLKSMGSIKGPIIKWLCDAQWINMVEFY